MSATRREIVISGRDAGLGSLMDRLRRSSSELGRELLQEALQNSKTSKDAIRFYEEQIRLIERRNKVYNEGLRQQASNRMHSTIAGGGDEKQARSDYRSSLSGINKGTREDQIQIQLLRELIETVKVTSVQEIRSERSTSESRANLISRTSQKQGVEYGELQRRMFQENDGTSSSSVTLQNIGDSVHGVSNVLGQRSFLGAAASGLSSVGSIGGALGKSALGKAGIVGMVIAAVKGLIDIPRQILADREASLSGYSALSGRGVSDLVGSGFGLTNAGEYGPLDLNISREDYVQNWLPQMSRSRGSVANSQAYAFRGMELMRGGGVDQGVIMQAARYGRVGGGDATSMAGSIYNLMRSQGVFGKDGSDFSRMSDMLSTLVQLQEQQMMSSGLVGSNANLNLLNRFTGLGGAFKREDYAASTITSLNSGLSQGGAPESQAIKFDVLRRLNPNKSYFELQAEMEKGIGSKGYAEGLMKMVKSTGGSLDSQMILFDQLTGGQMRKGDILKMFQGKMSLADLEKSTGEGGFAGTMRSRARRASSQAQTDLDFESEAMGDLATGFGEGIQDMIDAMRSFASTVNEIKEFLGVDKISGSDMLLGTVSPGILGAKKIYEWFTKDKEDDTF